MPAQQETNPITLARQTRNAARVTAWIAAIFATLALAGGIFAGVQLASFGAAVNHGLGNAANPSNCWSNGGTDTSC